VIDGADLDHIALAVEHWADAWPVYAVKLGAQWKSGAHGPGFSPAQLRYANDMRVELIEPNDVERNDFLRRFLDRHGPGPHHLTYKVPDIDAALAEAAAIGITPVGVDLSDPVWKEAFLHPRDALGIVVQLAQAEGAEWNTPAPDGFPEHAVEPAALMRVAHAVRDVARGIAFFGGLLGGEEIARGDDTDGRWVELCWPGPGRVRLVEPARGGDLDVWLGNRAGRVHHLAFTRDSASEEEISPREACGVFVRISTGDGG
jgi:catechol 2,3-dioxygenase-like lactoylglutathione lyase family enzyme